MENIFKLYKDIRDLKVQKELINKEINLAVHQKPTLSVTDFNQINENKKKIKEIDEKITNLKKQIEDNEKNSSFECSYSIVNQDGKTIESYKVNGKEVSKMDYIKSLKENSLWRRKLSDTFFNQLESNFFKFPFFESPFLIDHNKNKKHIHCDCVKSNEQKIDENSNNNNNKVNEENHQNSNTDDDIFELMNSIF